MVFMPVGVEVRDRSISARVTLQVDRGGISIGVDLRGGHFDGGEDHVVDLFFSTIKDRTAV